MHKRRKRSLRCENEAILCILDIYTYNETQMFFPIARLECSYGKIYIPVSETSVVEAISVTELARTHRNFNQEIATCQPARSIGLLSPLVPDAFLDFSSFRETAHKSREASITRHAGQSRSQKKLMTEAMSMEDL